MADLKISELNALAGSNLVAADELAIVDDSASETKKITVSDLIANGVTVISDDAIPGAKILFAAGDIATAALADSAVTTAKLNDSGVTAAKLADESTVDLVTTLPTSGDFSGQLAVDTDDNSVYCWNGSAWLSLKAPASINTVSGSTTGEINIVTTISGDTATVSATIDNTTSAAQFLAGPTGSGGVVGYRTVVGSDLPTATTSAKGGVVVNGNGLIMDGDTIEINNAVTSSGTHHVVTYDANGLITGGRTLVSSDLPIATASARGAVIPGDGLTVDVSGNLSVDNTVAADTYTKVTVTAQGLVSAGTTLLASDIPDHSAAKLTSGTIPTSILANSAVTGVKLADQATTKFGGALGSDNVTIFPSGDYKGQFFYDETTADLYIYTGSAYVPITLLTGNLVNAGVYNANTNLLSTVTTAGSSAGFTAGAALPAPTGTNLNHYVVVSVSGTGSGAAPAVALAPPDMLLSQGVGAEYSLIDVSNAIAGQTAANISVVAAGNIIATNVQSALQELDTEKLQLSGGDVMTGDLNLGTGVDIVFEGSAADDYETTLAVTNPTADRTITLPNVTGTVITTGDTGTVTSTMLLDGTIVNADINASAEIAVSKLANGTARQLLQTDSGGSGVEFTSNIDVPGTLDVTGAVTLDSTLATTGLISANGKISFPLGTAAAPSIYFGSDTNTGVFSPAGDKVAITTAGTQRVTVDSSGNVGIGTTAPQRNFHIHEPASSTTVGMMLTNGGTGASNDSQGFQLKVGGDTHAEIAQMENSNLRFLTNATERMRIDSSGRVLINETAAATSDSYLTVKNASAHCEVNIMSGPSHGSVINMGDTGDYNIGRIKYDNSTNSFQFQTNNTERLRIKSDGTLYAIKSGSLIANAEQTVAVFQRSSAAGSTSKVSIVSGNGASSHINFGDTDDEDIGQLVYDHSNNSMQFRTSSTEQMRIDSSGNVIVGGTSTSSTNAAYISQNGTYVSNRTAGTNDLFNGKLNGTVTSTINADGSISAAGSIQVGSGSAPAGVIASQFYSNGGTTTYHAAIFAQNMTAGGRLFSGVNQSSTQTVSILNTGAATFAGSVISGSLAPGGGGGNYLSAGEVAAYSPAAGNHVWRGWNASSSPNVNTSQIYANGNAVFAGTVSASNISDIRFKENITDANPQLADAVALGSQLKNFDWNDDAPLNEELRAKRFLGLVAQEAEKVCPGLTYTVPRTKQGKELTPAVLDKDGNETKAATYEELDDSYKAINHDILVMKLLGAVAELSAKVAALEAG